jgi:hypothetical protein
MVHVDDLFERRTQQVLLPVIPWSCHRASRAETDPQGITIHTKSKSQIAGKPASKRRFPADSITSSRRLIHVRQPDRHSSRTTRVGEAEMLSIRRFSFLFPITIVVLVPISCWSMNSYTASGACQAKPPNDFFCTTDKIATPPGESVVIKNIIFFCKGPTSAGFVLVNTSGPQSFSYEYPMTSSPLFPSGYSSISNVSALIHLGPLSKYTVDFAFPKPVTSAANCRFTASGESYSSGSSPAGAPVSSAISPEASRKEATERRAY